MKICSGCKEPKDLGAFNKASNRKDGRQNYCRDCQKSKFQNYYTDNKDEQQERARAFYQENRESRAATMKAWRQRNNTRMRAHYAKRRLLKKLQREEPFVDYEKILERDGLWCYLCNSGVEPQEVHFDHVVPLSKGGAHSMSNMKVTHSTCNLMKGTKLLEGHDAIINGHFHQGGW